MVKNITSTKRITVNLRGIELTPYKIGNIPCEMQLKELRQLVYFTKKSLNDVKQSQCIVEIGSWQGGSTVAMGRVCKQLNRGRIIAIDPHKDTSYHHDLKIKSTLRIIRKNIKNNALEKHVKIEPTTSKKAFPKYKNIKTCMILIDGDHDYQAAKQDFSNWSKTLLNGGFLLLHDTLDFNGPRKVLMELLTNNNFAYIGNFRALACFRKEKKLSLRNWAKKIYALIVFKMFFFKIYRT